MSTQTKINWNHEEQTIERILGFDSDEEYDEAIDALSGSPKNDLIFASLLLIKLSIMPREDFMFLASIVDGLEHDIDLNKTSLIVEHIVNNIKGIARLPIAVMATKGGCKKSSEKSRVFKDKDLEDLSLEELLEGLDTVVGSAKRSRKIKGSFDEMFDFLRKD